MRQLRCLLIRLAIFHRKLESSTFFINIYSFLATGGPSFSPTLSGSCGPRIIVPDLLLQSLLLLRSLRGAVRPVVHVRDVMDPVRGGDPRDSGLNVDSLPRRARRYRLKLFLVRTVSCDRGSGRSAFVSRSFHQKPPARGSHSLPASNMFFFNFMQCMRHLAN